MRFAPIPTNNSVLSNSGELRRQSRHVVMFSMKKRPAMTWRDVAAELPNSKEEREHLQGGTTLTPQARGPAVA
jgi:hypothetical protein